MIDSCGCFEEVAYFEGKLFFFFLLKGKNNTF